MEFYTKFADGDERWMRYSKDLFDSIPYAEYVSKISWEYNEIFEAWKIVVYSWLALHVVFRKIYIITKKFNQQYKHQR
jgi:hypothetical protein